MEYEPLRIDLSASAQNSRAKKTVEKLRDCEFFIKISSLNFYARGEDQLSAFIKFQPEDIAKWSSYTGEALETGLDATGFFHQRA